jgi:anti-sigma-K factor RskA
VENFQEYIESGILEQYALGELSGAEQAAVEAQAAARPEIQEELHLVQAALGFYAEAHAVTPPTGMRERVLTNVMAQIATPAANSSLRADVDAFAQTTSPAKSVSPAAPVVGEAVVRPMSSASAAVAPARSGWAIAASVALLLSLGGNALLYSNWKNTSSELVALQNENSRFATTTTVVEKQLGDLRQENEVLRNDEFRAVALAGTKTAPTAHAKVLFNAATHKVYVDVRSLPVLPADKQYQLWALDKGKPVDAGVLTVATASGTSIQHMKDIASAQTFAMTVEPVGGSANPTLSTMTVVGNI